MVARLDVALYQFENNLNYRFRSDCCAVTPEACESQCDLAFRLCFRPYDAEETDERVHSVVMTCELGSLNLTNKDIERNDGKRIHLRKSLNIIGQWPVSINRFFIRGAF